jgi:chemotaxis regulatin CheY-phosphate phosphatase CheZ
MADKKITSVEKLEKEFKDFKKEWENFRTNDFRHLVANVDNLIEENNKQHHEINADMMTIMKSMDNIADHVVTHRETLKSVVTLIERLGEDKKLP